MARTARWGATAALIGATTVVVPVALVAQVDPVVSGAYRGSWATMSGAGALDVTLAQSADTISGTAVFDGHPCVSVVRISGRVSGNVVAATLTSVASPVVGNTRLVHSPRGLDGPFSLVSGCSEASMGTVNLLVRSPISGSTPTPTGGVATLTPTPSPSATPEPSAPGDCDGDTQVTVEEVVAVVSIGVGTRPLSLCPAGDRNGDGVVTVDEVLSAVFVALTGIRTRTVPPPLVQRCLGTGLSECVCRGDVCCLAGACGVGDPCRRDGDCALGLRCRAGEGEQAVCTAGGGTIVPPPL